jgi:hypothetical protein
MATSSLKWPWGVWAWGINHDSLPYNNKEWLLILLLPSSKASTLILWIFLKQKSCFEFCYYSLTFHIVFYSVYPKTPKVCVSYPISLFFSLVVSAGTQLRQFMVPIQRNFIILTSQLGVLLLVRVLNSLLIKVSFLVFFVYHNVG